MDKDDKLAKELRRLREIAEKNYISAPRLMLRSFLQGLFVALGTTVGFSLVLAILTFVLGQFKVIPGVGDILKLIQSP